MNQVSRRKFLKAGVGLAVAGAVAYTIYPYLPPFPGVPSPTGPNPPASVTDVLEYQGATGRLIDAYGDPFATSLGSFPSLSSGLQYYLSQGFNAYPMQDASNGYDADWAIIQAAYKAAHGVVFGPTYGWGYADQFYNAANGGTASPGQSGNPGAVALWPNEQQWNIVNGALVPATAYGFLCVVIDAPELITKSYPPLYAEIDAKIGLKNFAGIAGWLGADHSWNYGGAQGNNGGHNLNSYARYVNNLPNLVKNYYLTDVTSSGLHNVDSTPCQIWSLRGKTDNYSAATCQPSLAMALDVGNYHHGYGNAIQNPQGLTSHNSSFGLYMASMNQVLEASLLAAVSAKTNGNAIARTACPPSIIDVTSYSKALIEQTTAGLNVVASSPTFCQPPYMNFSNGGDNGSNPGRSSFDEVAYPSTVLSFWTQVVPLLTPNVPIIEADTSTSMIVAQVNSTVWTQYATAYNKLTLDALYEPAGTQQRLDLDTGVVTNLLGSKGRRKHIWLSNTSEDSQFIYRKFDAKKLDMQNPFWAKEYFQNRLIRTGDSEDTIEIQAYLKGHEWRIIEVPSR